jgi:hypothetical protein
MTKITVEECAVCDALTEVNAKGLCADCAEFQVASKEQIHLLELSGHTNHCACRQVWGDGECECGVQTSFHGTSFVLSPEKGESDLNINDLGRVDVNIFNAQLLDEIKNIRIKNNSPWIELFRIALEKDREKAMVCAKQILENDAAINKLLNLIVEGEGK